MFKEKVNARTDTRTTDHDISSLAYGQWSLKTKPIPLFQKNEIFDVIKLRAFADDKFNIARKMISLFDSEENTMGQEDHDGPISLT